MKRAWILALLSGCATAHATPAPLTLTYFGVAGWSISDGRHTVLVDPYFSRPADIEHALPDEAAIAAHSPSHADVILIGHAHIDHALDAPLVALRTGATLIAGSAVTAKAQTAGLDPARIRVAKPNQTYAFDGLSIRAIPSLHSLIGAGQDVETFAYLIRIANREILVFDTANFIPSALTHIHPDIAIIATGLREKVPNYSCRLMRILNRPRQILPTHFDAWRSPPSTPLTPDDRADLQQFAAEIQHCASTTVTIPTPFTPLTL